MDDHAAETGHQKPEDGHTALLPGRDPNLLTHKKHDNNAEICRVEHMLPFSRKRNLIPRNNGLSQTVFLFLRLKLLFLLLFRLFPDDTWFGKQLLHIGQRLHHILRQGIGLLVKINGQARNQDQYCHFPPVS